uniref:Uncharacterized protein n=1 Tax=Arundo donax TaxID=35708 RepID=A0A0A9BQ62_ARUDO
MCSVHAPFACGLIVVCSSMIVTVMQLGRC